MRFRSTILSLCLVLLAPCRHAFGDSPPSWEEFSVRSSNQRYVAFVRALPGGDPKQPWTQKYQLRVEDSQAAGESKLVWEAPYHYDGYEGGALSNDGAFFAYVDYWYWHDRPAVTFYRRDSACSFTGAQLGIDRSSLEQTASHRLWLAGESGFIEKDGLPEAFDLSTVQGHKRIELGASIAFQGAPCGRR